MLMNSCVTSGAVGAVGPNNNLLLDAVCVDSDVLITISNLQPKPTSQTSSQHTRRQGFRRSLSIFFVQTKCSQLDEGQLMTIPNNLYEKSFYHLGSNWFEFLVTFDKTGEACKMQTTPSAKY